MGFDDRLIGGLGTLVRALLRSQNYVPGTSGWQVTKDGSAEFNSVAVRGSFAAGNPAAGHVTIDGTNGIRVFDAAGNLSMSFPIDLVGQVILRALQVGHITMGAPVSVGGNGVVNKFTLDVGAGTPIAMALDATVGMSITDINAASTDPINLYNQGHILPTGTLNTVAFSTNPNRSNAATAGAAVGTELQDAGVGSITFVAQAHHTYKVRYKARGRASAVPLTVDTYVRGQPGAVAPGPGAGTILAANSQNFQTAAGGGATTMDAISDDLYCDAGGGTFDLSAGQWTIAAFYKGTAGGAGLASVDQSGGLYRSLAVWDTGGK